MNELKNKSKFLRDVWYLTKSYWQSEEKGKAYLLLTAIIALTLGVVYMLVLLNKWNNSFYNALQNTAWEWLLAVSDRTQIEHVAVENDFHHARGYKTGEWMAPGQKICKQCGHQEMVTHSVQLVSCTHCGGDEFQRQPLSP